MSQLVAVPTAARLGHDLQLQRSPRVAFYTLGCKVNQAETDWLSERFRGSGFTCVDFESEADVYVINTCTVTHVGDSKSRHVIRQALRTNPGAIVVATGCYASIVGDRLPIDGITVIRNRDKARLVSIVQQELEFRNIQQLRPPDSLSVLAFAGDVTERRSRPMIKAQDGCDSACSYCIIPRARGRSRSTAPQDVIDEVTRAVTNGHLEVVITGVDLGSYGDDIEGYPDLGGLLRLVLKSSDVHRIRVSSVEPGDFKVEWLDLWSDSRLCPHLHVPLQAGDDATLARMKRKYSTWQFAEMIESCRAKVPGLAITTDIIVGFPGETEDAFERGHSFIEDCRFDGIHVFPYSRRSGTAAAQLEDDVPDSVKRARSAAIRSCGEAGKKRLLERSLGTIQEVVWETQKDGVWRGLSERNVRVYSADDAPVPKGLDHRFLTSPYRDGCWGIPVMPQATPPQGSAAISLTAI